MPARETKHDVAECDPVHSLPSSHRIGSRGILVRQLESSGETEVTSGEIGRLVMEALKSLDDVAYVRFASVYRNFREAKDFQEVLGELRGEEDSG